jgi:hypothetical protein
MIRSLETFRAIFRRPFQFREFLDRGATTDSAALWMGLGQCVQK